MRVFSSAWLLSKLSLLNVFSNLIGFYTSIQYSIHHSRTPPDIMSEAVLSVKKSWLVLPVLFCGIFKHSFEDIKREIIRCSRGACTILSEAYKFTSSKLNVLVFQVKTNTAWDSVLLGSRCHNFRHLKHSCSSCVAVLLTCLEDIAQNYLCHCFSYIPEICTIVLFLPF